MPYIDSASVFVPNVSYETRAPSLASATAHCTVAFTRYLDTPLVKITAQELRLKRAIEGRVEKNMQILHDYAWRLSVAARTSRGRFERRRTSQGAMEARDME